MSKHCPNIVQTSFTCQYLTLHFDVVPRLMMMVVGLGACLAFSLILQSSDCNGLQSRKVNASRHQVYSSLFKSKFRSFRSWNFGHLRSFRGKIGSPPSQASWHELVDVYHVDGTTKIGNATAWEVRRDQLELFNWTWMDLECWFQHWIMMKFFEDSPLFLCR